MRQEARRVVVGLYGQHEVDELGAIRDLARETFDRFGYGAVVEVEHLGGRRVSPIGIGFFLEPVRRDARSGRARWGVQGGRPQRRSRIVFWGESHRELVDQVQLWKSQGCPQFWKGVPDGLLG